MRNTIHTIAAKHKVDVTAFPDFTAIVIATRPAVTPAARAANTVISFGMIFRPFVSGKDGGFCPWSFLPRWEAEPNVMVFGGCRIDRAPLT